MLLLAAKLQRRFGQRRSFLAASIALVLATAAGALFPITHFHGGAAHSGLRRWSDDCPGPGHVAVHISPPGPAFVQAVYALSTVMFPATIVPVFLGGWAYNFDWRELILHNPFGRSVADGFSGNEVVKRFRSYPQYFCPGESS